MSLGIYFIWTYVDILIRTEKMDVFCFAWCVERWSAIWNSIATVTMRQELKGIIYNLIKDACGAAGTYLSICVV
jgi:hypothetical protein